MIDEMGIFRTTIAVSHLARPEARRVLEGVMVDTGSEYDWIARPVLETLGIRPERIERFQTEDGRVLEREVGFALIYVGDRSAPRLVVFAEPGDMILLGAIGLEGLNMRVDLARRQLVPAGPLPVAPVRAA